MNRNRFVFLIPALAAVLTSPPAGSGADLVNAAARTEGKAAGDSSPRVNGPMLGMVLDSDSGALSPILGIPGAALMGQEMGLPVRLSRASASAGQDYVLGIESEKSGALLIRTAGGALEIGELEGARNGADAVFLSPGGTAAALYFKAAGTVQIFTGLPGAPALSGEWDLSSLPSPAHTLAISDDGRTVLAAAAEGEVHTLFVATADGVRRLYPLASISAVSFLTNSADALLADRLGDSVYLIRDAAGDASPTLLASGKDGISAPAAVAASADGRKAYVGNAGSNSVAVLDIGGGPLVLLDCGCTPDRLERLKGNSIFRLTESSGQPLWIVDGASAEPRILFVAARTAPADSESGVSQ